MTAHVSLTGTRAAYCGPALDLAPHRNAAATLVIGLDATFELQLAHDLTARIALIPPGARHHLRGRGEMAFLYLDARSDDLARIAAAPPEALWPRIAAAPRDMLRALDADGWAGLLGLPQCAPPDPRIAAILARMDAAPDHYPGLAAAARAAGLSATRCQALLRAAVGMPFRRYRLWRRMALVVRLVGSGASLTEAAHAAGFNSSAHLSTSFRAMFGPPPARLLALGPRINAGFPNAP